MTSPRQGSAPPSKTSKTPKSPQKRRSSSAQPPQETGPVPCNDRHLRASHTAYAAQPVAPNWSIRTDHIAFQDAALGGRPIDD